MYAELIHQGPQKTSDGMNIPGTVRFEYKLESEAAAKEMLPRSLMWARQHSMAGNAYREGDRIILEMPEQDSSLGKVFLEVLKGF